MAHILVVEDEETIRNLICWNLEMVGHSCDMAADGWEAKKMMESGQFDLILLDIYAAWPGRIPAGAVLWEYTRYVCDGKRWDRR